jgi:transposase
MEENQQATRRRRKRHSAEFKAEAIKACLQPGVSVAAVALHYQLNANMLRTWVTAYERTLSEQNRAVKETPSAEFVALPVPAVHETGAPPDIVIEVKRGTATITVRWPGSAAADCANWLHGWLR